MFIGFSGAITGLVLATLIAEPALATCIAF
jgi:hypothetical protein